MSEIKRIEQIINEWKAKADLAKSINQDRLYNSYQYTILGLNLALDVIKGPSNTQLKIDGLKCWFSGWCEYEKSLVCHDKCEKYTPTT